MAYNTKSLLRDVDGKIVPQGFDLTADAYKALTGQNLGDGRFGLDGIQWGKTDGGIFVPMAVEPDGSLKAKVKVDDAEPVKVQLSGTIVAERAFANTAIRNTDTHEVVLNLAKMRKIWIVAYSELDQPPSLTVHPPIFPGGSYVTNLYLYKDAEWQSADPIQLTRYRTFMVNSQHAWLNDVLGTTLALRLKCSTAPTSGGVNITVYKEVYG